MRHKKQTPSDSPKSSGAIKIMQVKNTKSLQYFIQVKYSFLLQINVINLFYNMKGDLQHERAYRFE